MVTSEPFMSELRRDPLSDRWVIIAPHRSARPQEWTSVAVAATAPCPFCVGHEEQTPPPIATYPPTAGPADWQLRVVPNKFPAVAGDEATAGGHPLDAAGGEARPATGAHEVIIESPRHVVSFAELSEDEARLALRAYRDRLLALEQRRGLAYALIFKNARAEAGASLEHVHSQLLASPVVPLDVQYEATKTSEHQQMHGVGILERLLEQELDAGRRIVKVTPRFAVWCPFASRFPYETWIVPRQPAASFQHTAEEALAEAALLLREIIARLEDLLERPAYNFWIHSAPFGGRHAYHWRIEIVPRLARLAGFELGGGCFINPIPPQQAARELGGGAAGRDGS